MSVCFYLGVFVFMEMDFYMPLKWECKDNNLSLKLFVLENF